jgi:4-hydroxy-3-polyprenylbenzoate decarboxylase
VGENEQNRTFDRTLLPLGVEADDRLLEKWSTLLLFADNELEIDTAEISKVANCNYIVLFDKRAKTMTDNELLWLGAANTEPSRDFELQGATLIVDARAKLPKTGSKNPSRWPNVVSSDKATITLVNNKWSDYGIGDFISSPSEHYSALTLSEGAEWHNQ